MCVRDGEENRKGRTKEEKTPCCVWATINIYQSSYVQQSGHRRLRTWWQVKKMPLLCEREKQQIVMTLRTSLLTPPDISSEQQLIRRGVLQEEGMVLALRPHPTHDCCPCLRIQTDWPPSPSHFTTANSRADNETDNKTTGFIHRNALPDTTLAPISQVHGQFW